MNSRFLRRSPAVAARRLGDEMVLMSAHDSALFTLNEVAAIVWEAADGNTSLDAIVTRICTEFDVTTEQARADVEQLVSALTAQSILQLSDDSPDTGSGTRA